jgi:histidine triad (HIT) family protein
MHDAEKCPFCSYTGPSPILREYEGVYIIEPLNPVCEGHVLVIPIHHVSDFAQDAMLTCKVAAAASSYAKELGLGDCNLITSKGAAATQTVGHLHVHLVPRREGDGLRLPWA